LKTPPVRCSLSRRGWQAGWHFVEHRPLAGPASLVVAEA
jgi:hypothetical protein